jgi:hypothetical protein
MADTIAVRRPASARPRPPPAKEDIPLRAMEDLEDDGIAEDNETWYASPCSQDMSQNDARASLCTQHNLYPYLLHALQAFLYAQPNDHCRD